MGEEGCISMLAAKGAELLIVMEDVVKEVPSVNPSFGVIWAYTTSSLSK